MFSKAGFKPGKNQIHGRLKPQMLADQRRLFANKNRKTARKPQPKIILKNLQALEPHININLRNVRLPMLFLLLIFIPQILADTNVLRILIDGVKVHGKPVALLPPNANCHRNPIGVSNGSVCHFGGKTHYMKLYTPINTKHNQHLSYQVFNQQLAETNIGIKAPNINFFKKTTDDDSIYIASEHVSGIRFIEDRDESSKITKSELAKWAVASTFIFDLHINNIGITDEGIVALDLDGHIRPLSHDLHTNLMTAAHSIDTHTPLLSLNDIRQMKNIYVEMQSKPLPDHHNSFHLTQEMYQGMLKAFINICDKVITTLEANIPKSEHSQPDVKINHLWCQTVKDDLSPRKHSDDNFYNELCTEGKSGGYWESPHFY